jgi:hypothetical protein
MLGCLRLIALAGCFAAVSPGSGGAGEKNAVPAADPPANPCDVYGADYKPVGVTGTCVKIGGSISLDIGISSSGGRPSVATSTDWIRTKPGKNGN